MAKALKIDFTGTEKEIRRGGRAAHIPEGDYLFKVVKHELRKSKTGSRYIAWQVQCIAKKYKGKTIYHNTSLKPDALWNLRNLIFACTGKNVAGKVANFIPESLYGKIFAGTTEDDEYENTETGKVTIKSQLADLRPKEELEADDDEDEEDDDEEDDDEDEEDDEEEDDEDDEEEDEDDEDEEDEDEPPARRKRSSSASSSSAGGKKKAGKGKKKRRDDEDDDLEAVDVDDI